MSIFDRIVTGLDSDTHLVDDIDFSPFIGFICREHGVAGSDIASRAVLGYLEHCNVSVMSKPETVLRFLHICVDTTPPHHIMDALTFHTSEEDQTRARTLLHRNLHVAQPRDVRLISFRTP